MKKIMLTLLTLLFYTLAQSEEIYTQAGLESVTVFRQGAEISRKASVDVKKGPNQVVIGGLSASINPSSISVKVPSDVILLSISHRENFLVLNQKTPAMKALEDSIERVEDHLKLVQNEMQSLREEEDLLKLNKAIGGEEKGVDLEALKQISAFMRERIFDIKNSLSALMKKEKKHNEKLADLRRQLNEINTKRQKPTGEIVLEVSANRSARINLEVNYVVNNASWTPSYDVRVENTNSPARLFYKANIIQNTGVDWINARLNISTGNPYVSQSRPVLSPWFIDFYEQIRMAKKGYQEPQMMDMERMTNLAAVEEDDAEYGSISDYVAVDQNALNVVFEISLPYDIPSDRKPHMVAMKEYELKTDYQYHTVPKLDQDAFLLARVADWESLNLLPGESSIFFEGAFVGKAQINPRVTSDTLLLSLGRDKRIVIKREKLQDYTSTKFLGANKKETFAYKSTIRNTRNTPVNIEVLDHIPISQNKDIEVKLEESSNGSYDQTYGKLTWDMKLSAGESKVITLIYSVKYPKEKEIPGL